MLAPSGTSTSLPSFTYFTIGMSAPRLGRAMLGRQMRVDALGRRDGRLDRADPLAFDGPGDRAVHPAARPFVGDMVELFDPILDRRRVVGVQRLGQGCERAAYDLAFGRVEEIGVGRERLRRRAAN